MPFLLSCGTGCHKYASHSELCQKLAETLLLPTTVKRCVSCQMLLVWPTAVYSSVVRRSAVVDLTRRAGCRAPLERAIKLCRKSTLTLSLSRTRESRLLRGRIYVCSFPCHRRCESRWESTLLMELIRSLIGQVYANISSVEREGESVGHTIAANLASLKKYPPCIFYFLRPEYNKT